MKKSIVWSIGILFLMVTFACDGQDDSEGSVPVCGDGVVYSDGAYHIDEQLFVNWIGDGAPTEPCNDPGFGDGEPRPMNAYTWSLASFGGHLYAGIYNRLNDRHSDVPDTSEGGEIWRYESGPTVNSGVWEQEIATGFGNPTNMGIRIMKVYNNQLFAGTHNLDEGAELWRRPADTGNGKGQWQNIAVDGFGDSNNNAVRSMAVFNGKLYLGTANNVSGAKLFKFDADTDALTQVAKIGKRRKTANVLSKLVPIGDYLWIFSWGGKLDLSAFRMDRQENIEEADMGVVSSDKSNSGIISSAVFNGKIYVGTVNITNGAQMFVLGNPVAADIGDITWNRLGANVFQVSEKYLWRMQVFNGQLFIGGWNPFFPRATLQSSEKVGATLYRMNQDEGFCQVVGHNALIEEGFGQSENYGVRSMAEHNGRLYIGTAQVFKVVPGKNSSNAASREGTEVWEFDPIDQ